MDLSKLSDQDLAALHQQMSVKAINNIESSGAPDSSTIVNPKSGAYGSMQVMPKTGQDPGYGVRPSDGSPEDTARMGRDYMAAMQRHFGDDTTAAGAYNWGPGNMEHWQQGGADMSKIPDETLKYMYKYNQQMGKDSSTPPEVNKKVDSPLSSLSDEELKKLHDQQVPVSPKKQKALDFLDQTRQTTDNAVNALQGVGEMGLNMATGGSGMVAGGLHSLYDLATGKSDQATADIARDEQALTYQPRTPQGQAFAQKLGEGFGKVQGAMEQGAVTAMGALPFVGEDLAKSDTAKEVAKTAADVVANIAPFAIGGEGVKAKAEAGKNIPVKDVGAATELDKLNNLYGEEQPAMGPNEGPQQPQMGVPNAGPQRAPFIADSSGNVNTGLPLSDEGFWERRATQLEQEAKQSPETAAHAANDLFPETVLDTTGHASPYGQVERDMVGAENARPLTPEELERGGFRQEPSPQGELNFNPTGKDIQARLAKFAETPTEALDAESGVPHPQETTPVTRTMAPNEFTHAVEALAEKDPSKFSVPADMERAYNKYRDIMSGGVEDIKGVAKRFVEAVRDQMFEDKVTNHPTVKANQARVENLQTKLVEAQGKAAPTRILQSQLDKATKTLEKSKENIGKTLGADKDILPWEKDGQVNMFTFGHLPELMRSIGAILKALHGVVFRTLDRLPRAFSNLDSTGKIFAQGMRDKVSEQANRKWDTTVNEKPKGVIKGVPGLREGLKDYLPFEAREDLSPEQLKQHMQEAPDLAPDKSFRQFLRDNFLTGQQLQAFTHHPLVKYATETVDRAMRNSAQFVRENLIGKDGIRNQVRKLSDNEFSSLWQMIQENEGVREFTGDQMKRAGFTDQQIKVYQAMRQLDKSNLEALNRGRATAGLKPIDARVAHVAGHFFGDFKRTIVDSEGKVRAVIAHNLRGAVETITNRVLEQLGEGFTANPIEMRKLSEGNHTDRYTGYMNILNDLADRDDVVKTVMEAYKNYQTNDGQTAMKYRSAFKQKEGVIGAEGRKSWQSASANAKEGMKNFLRAQEAMHTWANMQEALKKISDFTGDPEIDAPNAKAAVQHYIDNVQHRNQGPWSDGVNGVINAVAQKTGIGPSVLKGTSNAVKTNLLTWFIGLGKLSHSFVTLIQPLQGIPVVNSLMRAEGSKLGLHQISAVLKSFGSMTEFSKYLAGGELKGFEKRAMDFARANDTLNTRQFQFGNLTDINRNRLGSGLHKAAEFNVTGMETGTRAFTYMYYAHMLRDLGLPESEAFHTAHNAMRDVMVDYNAWERPGIFGKLGFVGDLTAMLTRYKFNQIDQFMRGLRYAKQGQLGPMTTILTTSLLASGARGFMAYSLANSLVSHLTTWAAKNNLMQTPTSLDEMLLHFLHGKDQTFSDVVKFGLPAALGINMTGSLSHADDIPNDPLGALIPQSDPLSKYASGLYGVMHDPNKATAKNALYQLSPNSLRGVEENAMFTDDKGRYYDPKTGELRTTRDAQGRMVRNFGFRPLPEAREALSADVSRQQQESQAEVRKDILEKVTRDIDSQSLKGEVTPALKQQIHDLYAPKFLANGGDPRELANIIVAHQGIGKNLNALQREQGIPKGSLSADQKYMLFERNK